MMALVQTQVHEHVLLVTIDRPKALNALNPEVLQDLAGALEQLQTDDALGAAVLTGAGAKAFAAGADISVFPTLDPWSARDFAARGHEVLARIEASPKPWIAAVNGYALGGGCELALACDFRIASDNARFGQPEVNLGVIPGWGGTQRLAAAVGPGWARQLIFTGEQIDAQTALRIGLVNELHAPDALLGRALALAEKMAGGARRAIALAKEAVQTGLAQGVGAGYALERSNWALVYTTADRTEGVQAFLEKRRPQFKGV